MLNRHLMRERNMKGWIGMLFCAVSLSAIAATPRSAHDLR
jgi:hypothetical protein